MIFNKNRTKNESRLSLARWYDKVDSSGFKSFNVIASILYEYYDEVLNFFNNRSTNAFTESFNAKIKQFRAQLRGVVDIKFFFGWAYIYSYIELTLNKKRKRGRFTASSFVKNT